LPYYQFIETSSDQISSSNYLNLPTQKKNQFLRILGRWRKEGTSTFRQQIKPKESVTFDDGLIKRKLVVDMELA
jgi:hypothetical protein